MLIDTHTHLDAAEFDDDRDEVIEAARRAGVGPIVVLAIDARNFAAVRALAHSHPGVVYALGIHPLFVQGSRDEDLGLLRREIEASLGDPRFVAIGEIGLDHFVDGHDRDALLDAMNGHDERRPLVILADTIKGKGIPRIEDTVWSHYKPALPEDLETVKP